MSSLVVVAGARPNFMKVAPIIRAFSRTSGAPAIELVHTGQHQAFAMSGVFFEQLGIRPPDVELRVNSPTVGEIMSAFDQYIARRPDRPGAVLVVGDVSSTVAAAMVAAGRAIPVVHVEAGLRAFDRTMPEELNRIVTDTISELLLVSEPSGLDNLAREAIEPRRIRYVGNVMIDSLLAQLPAARDSNVAQRWGLERDAYALLTLHRPANVDNVERLALFMRWIEKIAATMPVVFPIHPRTRARLDELRLAPSRVQLCDPLGYREFISLMDGARCVMTDSGGVQEETSYLGVPCVTLRSSTERPVTLTSGTNVLVGDDLDAAANAIASARRVSPPKIDGWDGHAAERVAREVVDWLATR